MSQSDVEPDDPVRIFGTTSSATGTTKSKNDASQNPANNPTTMDNQPEQKPPRKLTAKEKELREIIQQEVWKTIGQDLKDFKSNVESMRLLDSTLQSDLKKQKVKALDDHKSLRSEVTTMNAKLKDQTEKALKDNNAASLSELTKIKTSITCMRDQSKQSLDDNNTFKTQFTTIQGDLKDLIEKTVKENNALKNNFDNVQIELKDLKEKTVKENNALKNNFKYICLAVMVLLIAICVWWSFKPSSISSGALTVDESKFVKLEGNIKSVEKKVIKLLKDDEIKKLQQESDKLSTTVSTKADASKEFIESKLTALKQEIDGTVARFNETETDLNSHLKQVKLHVETLDNKLNKIQNEHNTENEKNKKYVSHIDKSISTIEMNVKELKTTVSELESSKKVIIEQVSETIESLESLEKKFSGVNKAVQVMEDAERRNNETLEKQKILVDIIMMNVFNKGSAIVVILVLVVAVAFLAFWVHNLSNRIGKQQDDPGHQHVGNTSHQQSNTPTNPILKRLVANQTLENAVCLLSFDQDSLQGNTTLFKSVGTKTTMKSHVINSHEDILKIPPTKLYVIFAEFTERHVIIEQLGIGLGDLKRTTLDAVYKIKGSVIIVYVRDPGSKQLKPGARFNREIDCVTSQPELTPINRMGRFFSVFDKFTDFQKLSIHGIVTDELSE